MALAAANIIGKSGLPADDHMMGALTSPPPIRIPTITVFIFLANGETYFVERFILDDVIDNKTPNMILVNRLAYYDKPPNQ